MKRGTKRQPNNKGQIRIISGQWRGRKLPVLNAEGLRPTTDRTKETLFNWLMTDVRDAVCLDLFAGSGGLGFEALSRYASFVTFVEKDKHNASQLSENMKTLGVDPSKAEVVVTDALNATSKLSRQYDLVFLDPPFQKGLLPDAINALETQNLLADSALVYIECEVENALYTVPENWECIKHSASQQVDYRLYRINPK
ncbi:16S rRNA (guanine(966)-N(2))-methyltransferase RsmD [Aestuariibacter sp. AA17]|uniref:Ribosomal RNA small subunit methyltransferase D n=1 Tax=Fluctibacter corallii TaxID=2984329 RepID=A0ABT3AAD7_9ALTE|nr:16S rRNA (guanine(966)-N(2))-methyltransferase RsmD [Aestuariibacter sp. AA17]MCV2885644.1 16S rRNA (guanine(966)-N(2))-methyltransferase RsmD [Aestuariibacter sp. AA17]